MPECHKLSGGHSGKTGKKATIRGTDPFSLPPDREDLVVQRILVRNGVTRDLVTALLGDFRRALEYFEKHPASTPLSAAEGTAYHH